MDHDSSRWTGRGPQPSALRPERRRTTRWVLGFVIVSAPALAFDQTWSGAPTGEVPNTVLLLTLGLFVAVGTSPFARGRGHEYDEFERDVLARATARAYAALLGLVLLLFGWFAVATLNGLPTPARSADWLTWAVAFAVVASNLPAFLAEIAVPFPAEETEA